MSLMQPVLPSLKLLYIDKCLFIAVETFANNNFISYVKINLTTVSMHITKCIILFVLPPILSERLTALFSF